MFRIPNNHAVPMLPSIKNVNLESSAGLRHLIDADQQTTSTSVDTAQKSTVSPKNLVPKTKILSSDAQMLLKLRKIVPNMKPSRKTKPVLKSKRSLIVRISLSADDTVAK